MQTRWRAVGLVVLLALTLWGCSDGDDGVENVAGTYTGTVQDSLAGRGTVVLTIAQNGTQLSGTGRTTFADPANNNSGSLTGTLSGNVATLTLTPSDPQACPFRATVTIAGDEADGTYAAFNCTIAISGTVSLTRQ